MKRTGILLLTFVLLLSLTACGKTTGNAVVVEVGGVSVTKPEAEPIYRAVLQQTLNMYQQFGIPMDGTDPEFVTMMKAQALNTIGEQLALSQELTRLGIGLSDADQKAIDEKAKSEHDSLISQVVAYNQVSRKDAEEYLVSVAYTLDMIKFALRGEEIRSRLADHLAPGLSVSDDEILERYDALLVDQKETYEADSSQFATDVLNESIVVTRPSGFRHVKNIVIAMPDEVMAQIEAKDSELYDVTYHLYMIENELAAEETEESEKAGLEAEYAEHQAEFDRLSQDIEDLMKTGQEAVRPKAEEVLALCKAEGADFDALLAEYSSDRPTGDLLAKGYPVGAGVTTYVPTFTEAAMALQSIGEISGLVESVYGFHILQYAEDINPGVVPLEEVRAAISDLLTEEKREQALNDEIARIAENADIKVYADRF